MNTETGRNAKTQHQHLSIWSPRPDAPTLSQLSKNISVYGHPAISIVAVEPSFAVKAMVYDADMLIFTSSYSVTHALRIFSNKQLSGKCIIAIGKRTEYTLKEYSLPPQMTAPAPYSSEALLGCAEFQNMQSTQTVIMCGQNNRAILEKTLTSTQRRVALCHVYRRQKTDVSSKDMVNFIINNKINGIIISSWEIADIVASRLSKNGFILRGFPVFALSSRIANRAKYLGFTEIITSAHAGQDALNNSIIHWWNRKQS